MVMCRHERMIMLCFLLDVKWHASMFTKILQILHVDKYVSVIFTNYILLKDSYIEKGTPFAVLV